MGRDIVIWRVEAGGDDSHHFTPRRHLPVATMRAENLSKTPHDLSSCVSAIAAPDWRENDKPSFLNMMSPAYKYDLNWNKYILWEYQRVYPHGIYLRQQLSSSDIRFDSQYAFIIGL